MVFDAHDRGFASNLADDMPLTWAMRERSGPSSVAANGTVMPRRPRGCFSAPRQSKLPGKFAGPAPRTPGSRDAMQTSALRDRVYSQPLRFSLVFLRAYRPAPSRATRRDLPHRSPARARARDRHRRRGRLISELSALREVFGFTLMTTRSIANELTKQVGALCMEWGRIHDDF